MSSVALQEAAHDVERRETAEFGFWLYIFSDIMLFGAFFATFIVLKGNIAGGPSAHELFELPLALLQTLVLLASSLTCALALLAYKYGKQKVGMIYLALTVMLGVIFLSLEIMEFAKLVADGASWKTSGFLSSYFGLLGLHGLHVTAGLIWAVTLMVRMQKKYTAHTARQLSLFGIFWHFVDIIWIGVFTIVYILGGYHG